MSIETRGSATHAAAVPRLLRHMLSGAAMGIADAVPGVSGGTIAVVLGIYEQLIDSLGDMIGGIVHLGSKDGRWQLYRGLRFLVPLYLAAGTALIGAVMLLVGAKPESTNDPTSLRAALETSPGLLLNPTTAPMVFAFFFGLVVASIPEPWRQRHRGHLVDWALGLVGACVSGFLSLSPAGAGSTDPVMLIVAGAIAVSVMLLPGISGSLVLLVIGMYQPVASAVHARDLDTLLWFGGGIGLGVVVAVPCLRALLQRAHDRTMAVLSGLMAGSLVALWPWKNHYFPEALAILGPMSPQLPQGSWWWPLVAALAGGGVIRVLAARADGASPVA